MPGPAGLEAARIYAERGHRVTIIEAKSDHGWSDQLRSTHPLAAKHDRHYSLAL